MRLVLSFDCGDLRRDFGLRYGEIDISSSIFNNIMNIIKLHTNNTIGTYTFTILRDTRIVDKNAIIYIVQSINNKILNSFRGDIVPSFKCAIPPPSILYYKNHFLSSGATNIVGLCLAFK